MRYYLIRVFFAALFGLIKGCYINTLEYRLRSDLKLFDNACYCTKCHAPIALRDQFPIISYLVLKGKCRNCGEPIGVYYPVVEGTCALVYAIIAIVTAESSVAFVLIGAVAAGAYVVISLALRGKFRLSFKFIGAVFSLSLLDFLSWIGITIVDYAML